MPQGNIELKNRKKDRLKINNMNDFKDALKREGHSVDEFDKEVLSEEIIKLLNLDIILLKKINECIIENNITYRADNVEDFIDYIRKIIEFENQHKKLCEKISEVKNLYISRVEYDREKGGQEDVRNIEKIVEEVKGKISKIIYKEDIQRIDILEKEIEKKYLYSKDIELLKRMICTKNHNIKEEYSIETKIKTLSIKIPKDINKEYIKPKVGGIEYHTHLNMAIPRMKRLIENIDRYMKPYKKEEGTFNIDQSKLLQDSINIAVATFNNREFKAISGGNEIEDYCTAPPINKCVFKSNKVNRLGKLGTGYDRINDSEKKIFEEIHKQIEKKCLKNEGNLILYSKWEPCPSCYFVISQFCKIHPNINVKVRYIKKYGE
ncbi:MAG: deaminase domain-containing protein [Clostridium perfringens]|nr:deaminase domain-containing protein [Clostridium perfringens]